MLGLVEYEKLEVSVSIIVYPAVILAVIVILINKSWKVIAFYNFLRKMKLVCKISYFVSHVVNFFFLSLWRIVH